MAECCRRRLRSNAISFRLALRKNKKIVRAKLFERAAEQSEFFEADRLKWLQTAANIFDLVYTGDSGGFRIVPARADRSPRPHDHE